VKTAELAAKLTFQRAIEPLNHYAVASANLDDIMDYAMTCPEGES